MRLENQVAVITGAGRGIGKAIALAFAAEGADIVAVARTEKEIEETCSEVEGLGRQGLAVPTDITQADQIDRMVEKAVSRFKKVDILVNNAGIMRIAPALELTEFDWDTILDINVKGTFLSSRAIAKHMIKRKQGKIINMASIGGHIGAPGTAAYAVSKGGIIQLTKVLAVEWGIHNIKVNVISPGLILTEMAKYVTGKIPNSQGFERLPLKRAGKPEDITGAALFLASSESDYMTGQEIIIDGGTLVIHPRISI